MAETDVVFSITGDVRRNSRAIKQLRALASLGIAVDILSLGAPSEDAFLSRDIRVHGMPRPSGGGPLFFWHVRRAFTDAAAKMRARVYHASDLYALRAMRLAAKRHGGRMAYDARELYPHVASTAGRPWARAAWRAIEGRDIGQAAAIFTVSDSIATRLAHTYKLTPPVVLYNAPPTCSVRASPSLRARAGLTSSDVLLLHQGSIQKGRGCRLLADAMCDVQGAVLVFLGGGPLKEEVRDYVRAARMEQRIRFLDAVPPDSLLPVTAGADVGVTLLEDSCLNHRFALPNKLFEYLMAGLPVLASDLPEIGGIVKRFDVGCVVNPSDRPSLVQALQNVVDNKDLRDAWAANTRSVFETFNWETASQRFTSVYRSLLA